MKAAIKHGYRSTGFTAVNAAGFIQSFLTVVVPFKHYASEIIEGVLDDVVTSDDEDSEDYPCDMTMSRWKDWFEINRLFIEGYIRNIGYSIFNEGIEFLKSSENKFDTIRMLGKYWLAIIIRLIYNNGAVLAAEPPP